MQTDTHLSPGKAVANVGKELHNTRDVQAVVLPGLMFLPLYKLSY
jgi:hypothetical protein